MSKLKKCPFCGSEVSVDIKSVFPITLFLCDGCGACVSFRGAEHDLSKNFKAWERRALTEHLDIRQPEGKE